MISVHLSANWMLIALGISRSQTGKLRLEATNLFPWRPKSIDWPAQRIPRGNGIDLSLSPPVSLKVSVSVGHFSSVLRATITNWNWTTSSPVCCCEYVLIRSEGRIDCPHTHGSLLELIDIQRAAMNCWMMRFEDSFVLSLSLRTNVGVSFNHWEKWNRTSSSMRRRRRISIDERHRPVLN